MLCLTEQITFTEKCEVALSNGRLASLQKELQHQLESYTGTDIEASDEESRVLNLKLKALILDAIHFIDVIEQLLNSNATSTAHWTWKKQLRFYLKKTGNFK